MDRLVDRIVAPEPGDVGALFALPIDAEGAGASLQRLGLSDVHVRTLAAAAVPPGSPARRGARWTIVLADGPGLRGVAAGRIFYEAGAEAIAHGATVQALLRSTAEGISLDHASVRALQRRGMRLADRPLGVAAVDPGADSYAFWFGRKRAAASAVHGRMP